MGSFIDKLMKNHICRGDYRVIMLGLGGAGKTTLFYRQKLGQTVITVETIGFNVQTIKHRKKQLTIWDVGGNQNVRPLWKYYFQNTRAVIFVVDSSNAPAMEMAREEMQKLIAEDELRDALILVLANKRDVAVMSVEEMAEGLGLNNVRGRRWHIEGTCALTGEGISKGLDWLTAQMYRKE